MARFLTPSTSLGHNEAESPAVVTVEGGRRVVFFSGGMESSGIPRRWAATASRPGVSLPARSRCTATN